MLYVRRPRTSRRRNKGLWQSCERPAVPALPAAPLAQIGRADGQTAQQLVHLRVSDGVFLSRRWQKRAIRQHTRPQLDAVSHHSGPLSSAMAHP